MQTNATAAMGPLRRGLHRLKALFICERAVPQDRSTHVSYLIILMVLLLAPFLVDLEPANPRPLSLWGLPLPPGCPSQHYLHLECPGCGMTRSFVALTHGQWALAWSYHRIGILLYIYFTARVLTHIWLLMRPEMASHRTFEGAYNASAWVMIALLLLNWLFGVCTGSNGG